MDSEVIFGTVSTFADGDTVAVSNETSIKHHSHKSKFESDIGYAFNATMLSEANTRARNEMIPDEPRETNRAYLFPSVPMLAVAILNNECHEELGYPSAFSVYYGRKSNALKNTLGTDNPRLQRRERLMGSKGLATERDLHRCTRARWHMTDKVELPVNIAVIEW